MHIVGEIILNLSLICYLVLYLPQLVHNLIYQKIEKISLGFHSLLFIAASADFYYGFGRITQWQYQLVTVTMFSYLLVQHIHLFIKAKHFNNGLIYLSLLSIIIIIMLSLLPLSLKTHNNNIFIFMGWIERISYLIYSIPQFFKNRNQQDASGISPLFIGLAIFTSILDTLSAWIFSWGSPSLYGAPISIGFHLILLYQWFSLKKIKRHEQKLLFT